MAQALTPEQVDGWIAYDAVEPLGLRGVVRQFCDLLAMVAAHAGADVKPSDFLPGVKPPERQQTEAAIEVL